MANGELAGSLSLALNRSTAPPSSKSVIVKPVSIFARRTCTDGSMLTMSPLTKDRPVVTTECKVPHKAPADFAILEHLPQVAQINIHRCRKAIDRKIAIHLCRPDVRREPYPGRSVA